MDDLISRQAVLKLLHALPPEEAMTKALLIQGAKQMDAAQPERKKGKWIWKTGDVYKCSECETETHVDECFEEPIYNYCPYCNAVMDGYER